MKPAALTVLLLIALAVCAAPPKWVMLSNPVASGGGTVTNQPMVTAQTLSFPRSDFDGDLGYGFTAASAITVTSLGRWVYSGNSQSHTLKLYDVTTSTLLGSCSVATSGAPTGDYKYGTITPVTLVVGHIYNVTSQEFNGGDQWGSYGAVTISGTVASSYGGIYQVPQTPANDGFAYIPVNLLYH